MKNSAVFFITICLVQMAFTQLINRGQIGSVGANINTVGVGLGVPDVAAIAQLPVTGPFGGTGTGDVSVAGEVQAAGKTVVTGQVPVIGTVTFSGSIPAGGVVSIAGNCGCGSVPL